MNNLEKFLKRCWPRRSPVCGVYQENYACRDKHKQVQDIPVIIRSQVETFEIALFVLRHEAT